MTCAVALLVACGAPVEFSSQGADAGGTTEGETTTGSVTTGVDAESGRLAGPPPVCVQSADDVVPCSFTDLEDPVEWSVDAETGLRSWRAKAAETQPNGWPASAYLVEVSPPLEAVEVGAENLPPPPVPPWDDRVEAIEFGGSAALEGPDRVTVREGGATRVGRCAPTTWIRTRRRPGSCATSRWPRPATALRRRLR